MSRYTADSKERVRDAVDFVELVSASTELRRAGPARYEGRCPFHDERTPSFGIDPEQKVFYCFGCNASGDVFTFVQDTEGVDFKGALELLAERYGVELEREAEDPKAQEQRMRRERLLELLERTTAYYERYLWESREAARAREYLTARGLREEILREFRVGFAPSAWNSVLLASRAARYSNREIYDAGLVQRSRGSGQVYDRFRARITFPLADIRGRVLGFGARSLADDATITGASAPPRSSSGGRPPKYLNTADGEIYHKGLHLYGAHLARTHATRAGRVILCEGYTDVIALHQAGLRNAVGLMGTALTGDQVAELSRMATTVLLALDADAAGQDAMLRASALAAKRKLELRVVALPDGKDPADLIAERGAEEMSAAIERSVPFVRFRVERALADGDVSSPEGRDRIIDQLVPVFATIPLSAMRMELTRVVSERLSLPESLAERLLVGDRPDARSAGRDRSGGAPRRRDAPLGGRRRTGEIASGARAGAGEGRGGGAVAPRARGSESERAFLALCIALPDPGAVALADLDLDDIFSGDVMRRAAHHLREHLSDPASAIPPGDDQLAALIAELVVEARRGEARPEMLAVQRLQLELAKLDREIRLARGAAHGAVSELAERRSRLKDEFDRATTLALEHAGAGDRES